MPLPPAVQDFLDMSSDPDFDDLDGYQADTSINTNDSTRSSTPVMTLSDDLLSNPACWPTHHANRIRARLLALTELPHISTPTPPKDDSVTEPESEPEEPPIEVPPPALLPPKDDPSSVTEPESDDEELPIKLLPPKEDPSSVTEPESDVEELPITGATITPKKRGFFDTPSPPGPDSIYWKYVSREEDAKWNDRAHTDESFHAVRQIKQELKNLS
ncbi:hypothetical protein EDD22DRAFT_146483 [Suillus occidentalis]|nr:hypothetical protein EDD22DRAFT_410194 [Suillus occidentalis]KAG1759331.1 hypothetical protein EDD22DRAFT_146483 [Suillus occidentalis]